nr:DUF4190 domain-containing protein [uncultured Anaerostipes sp.]
MEEKHYDPYTGYEVDGDTPQREETSKDQEQQEGSHGLTVAAMILGIVSVVLMLTCCCSPFAIFTGIAAIVLFAVSPKRNGKKEPKAIAGLVCGIVSIIGTFLLIAVFVVNIVWSDEFQDILDENLQDTYEQQYEHHDDYDEIF